MVSFLLFLFFLLFVVAVVVVIVVVVVVVVVVDIINIVAAAVVFCRNSFFSIYSSDRAVLVPTPRIGHRASSECPVIDPRTKLLRPLPGMYLRQSFNPPSSTSTSTVPHHGSESSTNQAESGANVNNNITTSANFNQPGTLNHNNIPTPIPTPQTSSPITSPRPFPTRPIGDRGALVQSAEDWGEKLQQHQLQQQQNSLKDSTPDLLPTTPTKSGPQHQAGHVPPLTMKPLPDPTAPKSKGTFLSLQQMTKPTGSHTGDFGAVPLSPRGKPNSNPNQQSNSNASSSTAQQQPTGQGVNNNNNNNNGGNQQPNSATQQAGNGATAGLSGHVPLTPLTPFKKTEASMMPLMPR
jgi:hypothetical protein